MIQLGSPDAVWLLVLVPLVVLFLRWRGRQQQEALERFASSELVKKLLLQISPGRRRWKLALVVIALVFISMALARPQYGMREEIVERRGMDIVVAVDTSDSMLAEDIAPNRLMVAQREIGELIDRLQGDRIALVPFAGDAFVQCPLTLDYSAARLFLNEIDSNTISVPGTALGRALEVANRCFVQEERKYKAVILITDGEETIDRPKPQDAAKAAVKDGVRIYTIGVGTRGGVPIPVRDAGGNLEGYKQTKDGEKVLSRLDETTLRDVAVASGGFYSRATTGHFELDKIYNEINQLEEKELRSAFRMQGIDRFQFALFPALLLLVMEPLLSERRTAKEKA